MVHLNWSINASVVWSILLVILIGSSVIMEAQAQRTMAVGSNYPTRTRSRSIRGFKQGALSTARGFGKRAPQIDIPSSDPLQVTNRDSFPIEWFVDDVQNNPILARLLVRRLLDMNRNEEMTNESLSPYISDKIKEEHAQRQETEDAQPSPYM